VKVSPTKPFSKNIDNFFKKHGLFGRGILRLNESNNHTTPECFLPVGKTHGVPYPWALPPL
jgi:hypothetical protein